MANGGIDSNEFFSALDALSKERRINKEILFNAIEAALISAYKKNFGKNANVRASIDGVKGVNVNLVFEPAWDQSMMSEEAKLELGLL